MTGQDPGTITRAVNDVACQLHKAPDDVIEIVYNELRSLARRELRREHSARTLHTTALVNEAFVRLMGGTSKAWDSRAHFFGSAALAMRRLLIEEARRRARRKASGALPGPPADADPADAIDLLALDEALDELAKIDPHLAQIVNLRYFAGLSVEDTASALQISERTVKRDWAMARAWLFRRMSGEGPESG